jgi:uncharacterized RDD family membrane protein YckC/Tfp pilus assembly major pilin PilA
MIMFCSQCGAENADAAELCVQCGRSLIAAVPVAAAAPAEAPPVFASFWIRVGAAVIDTIIVAGSLMLLSFVGLFSLLAPPLALFTSPLYFVASFIGPWLYTALFESSAMQATPGKKAIGIKVTDLQGNRISFGRATGRHFAEWITGMTFFVGYVMVTFTQKRQSLHDMIAETVVVAAGTEPAQVAAAPAAKPMSPWGIAGIFLLAFLPFFAILGIVAAIAIPAYQDYTVRSQVTEGIAIASDFKNEVALYAAENGHWPADLAEAGLAEEAERRVDGSRYLESLDIAHGTITLTYGKAGHERIRNKRLSFRPYVTEGGDVGWLCGRAAEPGDAYYDVDDGGQPSEPGITSLPDKHLPSSCRAGALNMDDVI